MAPTLTATVQQQYARVRLSLTWPGIQTALIERQDPDGTWRPVRGPDGDQIVCYGSCAVFDHEAPLDQAVSYRATSPQGSGAVNANIYFESGVGNWTGGNGGTLASSGTQHHQGALAARLTPNGSTANTNMLADEVAVTVGETYGASVWLWSTAAFTWRAGITWYDSSHTFLSSMLLDTALSASTWTNVTTTATAPTSAAYAKLTVQASGTPASSNILYVDEAMLISPDDLTVTSSSVTVASSGAAWLSHPGHPQYNAATTVTDIQASYAGRAGTFWAIGAAVPIAVVDVRGGGEGTVVWQTKTVADYQRIRSLIADGGVLLMRLPAAWDGDSWWFIAGDIAEVRITNRPTDGWRRYQMSFTRVDRPAGPSDGAVGQTWADVKATYATWADLKSASKTWTDLATSVS